MTTSRTVETLLAHRDWLRALASSLVADPALADDVAQQTMLEAIERPPRHAYRPQGWLRSAAQNAARALARQERRRQRREQVVARRELVDADPADTAHRAAMHKRLVDELFALEEPYHTVVLLRFFDDLEARQIAARLGRPLATVRTQLQRGLERMRQRLDREYGDRRAWCTAVLPLCAARPAAAGVPILATLGVLAMWKWILPAAAVCAALFFTLDPFAPAPPAPAIGGNPSPAMAQAAAPAADRQPARTVVPVPGTSPAGGAAALAVAPHALRGRVITVDGRAVPALTLAFCDPKLPRLDGTVLHMGNTSLDVDQPGLREMLASEAGVRALAPEAGAYAKAVAALIRGEPLEVPRATTDGAGHFELDGVEDAEQLRIEGSDWIIYGIGRERGSDEPVLVVGPGVRVAGRVIDEQGNGIDNVYVSLGFSLQSLPGFTQQLQSTNYRSWNENSRGNGDFRLGVVPAHPSLKVTAQKRGYETLQFRAPEITSPVVWTLRTAAPARFALTGMVRRADGAVAAGAVVTFGQDGGIADARGQFKFDLTCFDGDTQLLAWLPGLQPAIVDGLGVRLTQDAGAGRDLTLTLGAAALTIAGRVLDERGAPRADVRVVLVDGVVNGSYDQFLESAIGKQGEIRTARDGKFTLRGLATRNYTVRAIDCDSLLVVESGPVAAGTEDLVLRTPADAFLPRVEGLLVDRHGSPVVGATVRVTTLLQARPHGATWLNRPGPATSDGEGRFVLERCPRRHVKLSIGGTDVIDASAEIPADGGPLRVQVARRLRFRITVPTTLAVDRFAVLDDSGERIRAEVHKPDFLDIGFVHDLRCEQPPVCEVDDSAAALLLLDGEREVRRVPLSLRPGELNRVDL